jgi:hypothetical protein
MLYFIHFANVAPSIPRNLTLRVESNTTISVSWLPPENENGIIIQYTIHVGDQGVNSNGRIVNVSGGTTSTLVNLLKPYTNYTFRIRARTSAGWGNFSEKETERTDEGRMHISLLFFIHFAFFVSMIQNNEIRTSNEGLVLRNIFYVPNHMS